MKDLDSFHAFLESSGATLLEPTNKYEVTRFKVAGRTSVVYQNKKGSMTFVGDADVAYHNFKCKIPWKPERKSRKPASQKKAILAARDGLECFYCGVPFDGLDDTTITIEHLLNVSQGGNNHDANLTLACRPCNHRVGDMPIVQKVAVRVAAVLKAYSEAIDTPKDQEVAL